MVEEEEEQQGAEGVPLVYAPFHWEGSSPLAPHSQGSASTLIDLRQTPHNIPRNPKLILKHLPKLLPTHPVISLL